MIASAPICSDPVAGDVLNELDLPPSMAIAVSWDFERPSASVDTAWSIPAAFASVAPITFTAPAAASISTYWGFSGAGAVADSDWSMERSASIEAPLVYSAPAAASITAAWDYTVPAGGEIVSAWELSSRNPAIADWAAVWLLESSAALPVITDQLTARRVNDDMLLDLVDLEISGDEDSWLWSFQASAGDINDWKALREGDELEFVIAGLTFRFVVDSLADSSELSLSGRSPSAVLESTPSSVTVSGHPLASAIVGDLCMAGNLSLDWQTVDWPLPGDALGSSSQSAIKIIQEVAAA